MFNKILSYKIFRIIFSLFLLTNIIEPRFNYNFDLIPFIHVSDLSYLKFFLIILLAFLIIPSKEYVNLFKEKHLRLLFFTLLLLIIICYISSYFSEFQNVGFGLTNRIFLYFIILIICAATVKYFEGAAAFILKAFIYSNCIIITGSLLDFIFPEFHNILVLHFNRQEVIHSYVQIGTEKIMRPMGFISDSNLAAFSISFALMLLLLNYKKFNKIFRVLFYISGTFIFGMLSSRSSLVMCVFCLIVFYLYTRIEKKELNLFVLIFIVFQLLTLQTYGRILSYFDKEKTGEEFSFGRPVIWNASLNVFKENILIGKGPGGFFEVSDSYIRNILKEKRDLNIDNPEKPDYHQIDKVNPHNIFLVALAETGITGFIFFIFLNAVFIIYLLKSKKHISFLFLIFILFVSSLSNFAPYYKYYLLLCIIFYLLSNQNMKPALPAKNQVILNN